MGRENYDWAGVLAEAVVFRVEGDNIILGVPEFIEDDACCFLHYLERLVFHA